MGTIDVERGIVILDNEITIERQMKIASLLEKPIHITQDVVVGNGWRRLSFGPNILSDAVVGLTLFFFNDVLQKIQMGLWGLDAEHEPAEGKTIQDQFLRRLLGAPSSESARTTGYEYKWGNIGSSIDPHNSFSYICLNWIDVDGS